MSRLAKYLDDESRVAELIVQVESGEDVDLQHVLTCQALDFARVGELFALDAIEAEEAANAEFERFASQ